MTDKIIIGDIDVTECNFRLERDNQQKCECCHATGFGVICDCEKWHNCYFKQLKRVEQEYDTLKSENFTFEELVKYQDEQLEPFNDGYFEHLDTKMIADLAKKSIRLTTENRKLENALEEIEEIAKNDCENCCECSMEFNLQESCSIYEIQNIINKANTAPATIFDRIRSFDSGTLARFIHALISCHEKYTCDDCYIASLPFQRRICDTKETLEEIKAWLNEEFKE